MKWLFHWKFFKKTYFHNKHKVVCKFGWNFKYEMGGFKNISCLQGPLWILPPDHLCGGLRVGHWEEHVIIVVVVAVSAALCGMWDTP